MNGPTVDPFFRVPKLITRTFSKVVISKLGRIYVNEHINGTERYHRWPFHIEISPFCPESHRFSTLYCNEIKQIGIKQNGTTSFFKSVAILYRFFLDPFLNFDQA